MLFVAHRRSQRRAPAQPVLNDISFFRNCRWREQISPIRPRYGSAPSRRDAKYLGLCIGNDISRCNERYQRMQVSTEMVVGISIYIDADIWRCIGVWAMLAASFPTPSGRRGSHAQNTNCSELLTNKVGLNRRNEEASLMRARYTFKNHSLFFRTTRRGGE